MSEYCIVVAEGARARFFTVEPAEIPEFEGSPNLVEHAALANPQHQAHDDRIYADTRGGRNRTPGGQGHGYDEHRDRHDDALEHRFAKDIAEQIDSVARSNGTRRVILCAEKRMLGFLRDVVTPPPGADIVEIGKDLAGLSPTQLHRHLSRDGHIPARQLPRNGV